MAQLLVKTIDNTHVDPDVDCNCYKRGMSVVAMNDAHIWGRKEGLPEFFQIKIPLINTSSVEKYLQPYEVEDGTDPNTGEPIMKMMARRLWQIQIDTLPSNILTKLESQGEIIIKATDSYADSYDMLWSDFKSYILNLETNQVETEDLV